MISIQECFEAKVRQRESLAEERGAGDLKLEKN
jgi:hypothetical protein